MGKGIPRKTGLWWGISGFVVGPDGFGVKDGPAVGGGDIDQRRRWIDGEGAACDFEHGGVVDGVAEDGVGVGDADAAEGFGLAFVGGDVDELAGDDAVFDLDGGREDAADGNVEALDAFFNDPVVGGTDGPDFRALLLELGNESAQFGEDLRLDVGAEVFGGGAAEFVFVEAGVDLDHFAADVEFGDFALAVEAMAGVDPVRGIAGEQADVHGPVHEADASVAGPEGAVAVKDGGVGLHGKDFALELLRREAGGDSGSGWGSGQAGKLLLLTILRDGEGKCT
jgi:hypothetical protein